MTPFVPKIIVMPIKRDINTRIARFLSRNTLWNAIMCSLPPLVEFLLLVFFGAKFWNFKASTGEIFAAAFAGALQAIQTVTAEKMTDRI